MLTTPVVWVKPKTDPGGKSKSKKDSPAPTGSYVNHVQPQDDLRRFKEMYEFGEKLGEGSFGTVWVVTLVATGQRYACKIINKEKVLAVLAGGP